MTPLCAPSNAPAPIVTWSARPTCPPIMTPSPIVQLPEMPHWPATMQCRPIVTLCAIWTRLSILVPSPMTVSPNAPRSIGAVGPDLDVVLDDDTADLRHLAMALGARDIAEAILPDRAAGMHDHAIADQVHG